jgi:hypothetical protein
MHQFHKFILAWNSTCFGQFLCPSSGFYSLYTQQWYVSYRFVDSFRAGSGFHKPVWHKPLLSVQWINSWWWRDELVETCRVSFQNKFVKLVHLVGAWGSVVVKALRYFSDGPGIDSRWCHWVFQWHISFRPYHGPGVDSAPSENEYQEHSWG